MKYILKFFLILCLMITPLCFGTAQTTGGAGSDNIWTLPGDFSYEGHKLSQIFSVNEFQPQSDVGILGWDNDSCGVFLRVNQNDVLCWVPLAFIKHGDEIISYDVFGFLDESTNATLDCKLVRVNTDSPVEFTDVAGGSISQITDHGTFVAEAVLDDPEAAGECASYRLELTGNTGSGDEIYVIGADVVINRK